MCLGSGLEGQMLEALAGTLLVTHSGKQEMIGGLRLKIVVFFENKFERLRLRSSTELDCSNVRSGEPLKIILVIVDERKQALILVVRKDHVAVLVNLGIRSESNCS